MSQHYFNTRIGGKSYIVQMGWDKPLQRYYLVINNLDGDEPLYSNLCDPNCTHTLDYFVEVLEQYAIKLPHDYLDNIRFDREHNNVNQIHKYYV